MINQRGQEQAGGVLGGAGSALGSRSCPGMRAHTHAHACTHTHTHTHACTQGLHSHQADLHLSSVTPATGGDPPTPQSTCSHAHPCTHSAPTGDTSGSCPHSPHDIYPLPSPNPVARPPPPCALTEPVTPPPGQGLRWPEQCPCPPQAALNVPVFVAYGLPGQGARLCPWDYNTQWSQHSALPWGSPPSWSWSEAHRKGKPGRACSEHSPNTDKDTWRAGAALGVRDTRSGLCPQPAPHLPGPPPCARSPQRRLRLVCAPLPPRSPLSGRSFP